MYQASTRGSAITITSQFLKLVLNMTYLISLSHILGPDDFGLVAMVTLETGLLLTFYDLGFRDAILQKEDITEGQASKLFWLCLAFNIVLAVFVIATGPLLCLIFGEQRLLRIAIVISPIFIASGMSVIHMAMLRRALRFKDIAWIEVLSLSTGVGNAICMAVLGYGYWSIVAMPLVTAVATAILSWIIVGWIPGLPKSGTGVWPRVNFGMLLSASNIINYLSRNFDNMIVGWFLGARALGIYSRSYQLMTLPMQQINGPIGAVMTPVLCKIGPQQGLFRDYYLQAINASMWLTCPMLGLMGAYAHDLVRIMFGSQWREVADIFSILLIAGWVQPIYNSMGWVFIGAGRSGRLFQWSLISAPVYLAGFFVGVRYGISGVAIAYVITFMLLILPWTLPYVFCHTKIRVADLIGTVWGPLSCGLVLYAGCRTPRLLMYGGQSWWEIGISLVMGIAAVVLYALLVPQVRRDLVSLVSNVKMLVRVKDEVKTTNDQRSTTIAV